MCVDRNEKDVFSSTSGLWPTTWAPGALFKHAYIRSVL